MTGLVSNIQEWKQPCRNAWENDHDFLQTDSFAKIAGGKGTNGHCNEFTL